MVCGNRANRYVADCVTRPADQERHGDSRDGKRRRKCAGQADGQERSCDASQPDERSPAGVMFDIATCRPCGDEVGSRPDGDKRAVCERTLAENVGGEKHIDAVRNGERHDDDPETGEQEHDASVAGDRCIATQHGPRRPARVVGIGRAWPAELGQQDDGPKQTDASCVDEKRHCGAAGRDQQPTRERPEHGTASLSASSTIVFACGQLKLKCRSLKSIFSRNPLSRATLRVLSMLPSKMQ